MTAKNKYKSPAFEAIHSAASGLFSVGAIHRKQCAILMNHVSVA